MQLQVSRQNGVEVDEESVCAKCGKSTRYSGILCGQIIMNCITTAAVKWKGMNYGEVIN